jgi:hypothetical protein
MARLTWKRTYPGSINNFELTLENPEEIDVRLLNTLLDDVVSESHRGLSLSSRAVNEFRRWLTRPDTPLASEAYVLLSNWFMTNSGDRNSKVATRCETLWDALFSCRPLNRLSSPQPGRNHLVVEHEFKSFWNQLREAQGEQRDEDHSGDSHELPSTESRFEGFTKVPVTSPGRAGSTDNLRATLEKQGLRCHVEGSPQALADFLNRISGWDNVSGEPSAERVPREHRPES